jgi:hypothetical protein
MKTRHLLQTAAFAVVSAFSLQPSTLVFASPLGTAFNYQGRLAEGGNPANGSYDLRFSLYDALASGSQVGSSLTSSAVAVSNGLFAVTLDFGGGVFEGTARWLAIEVRTNGNGAFVLFSPRQPLNASPYALYAPAAGNAQTVANGVCTTNFYANPAWLTSLAGTKVTGNISGNAAGFTGSLAGDVTGPQTATVIASGVVTSAKLASDAASLAKVSGGAMANSGGKVGIGTSNPQNTLHVNGGVQFDKTGSAIGRLVLNTVTRNDPGRYGILFSNNLQAPFLGDDTQPIGFAFLSGWSNYRTNDASVRVHGKASASWGKYVEMTHDGTNGVIKTDAGHLVLAPGGNVGIGTTSPATKLDVNGTMRATTVTITSDRAAKEDFAPVDAKEILQRVASVPIQTWVFKSQPTTRHSGPVAQDFYAAFGVGSDDKHIATVDADGAALAAIQGLYQMVKEKEVRIEGLEKEVAGLKSLVNGLLQKSNGGGL